MRGGVKKSGGAPVAPDPVYMVPMCTTIPPQQDSNKGTAALGYEYMQHQPSPMGYEYMQHQPSTGTAIYDSVDEN